MKMGVSTTPWLRVRRPRRAWPSVLSSVNSSMGSVEEHRIAITEEAIARLDGVAIQAHDGIVSGKGAHQHQQRGAGQVEIGDQAVDHAELEAGGDEDAGVAACLAARGPGFKGADRRRAYGDHAAASIPS